MVYAQEAAYWLAGGKILQWKTVTPAPKCLIVEIYLCAKIADL
jgi:hypothetical protein